MGDDKPSRHEVLTQFRTREIIDAAIELFSREGMGGVTMERVAELASVAKGTIYLYFEDKSALLDTAFQHVLELLVDAITEALGDEGALRPRLARANEESIRLAAEYREIFDFVHHSKTHGKMKLCNDDGRQAPARQQLARLLDAFSSLFREAMERGEIAKSDPGLLAQLYLESLHAVLYMGLPKKAGLDEYAERDVYKDTEFVIDLFLNGISVSKDRER